MGEFLSSLSNSFINQGGFGFIICFIIGIVSVFAIVKILGISKIYKNAIKEFNGADEVKKDGIVERDFTDDKLKNIVKKFKNSAEIGTDDINTEVIIQKEYSEKVKWEKQVKGLPGVLIALGLIGTFLGLVMAIGGMQGSFGEIQSMDMFKESMKAPLSSMGGAFWTSILGVVASLIVNLLLNSMNTIKDTFYDLLEDYLDNNIYAKYAKNFNATFDKMVETLKSTMDEFNNSVATSMKDLSVEMSVLFNDGVEKLVNKINKNTIDLTDSMRGLQDYTKDLKRLTASLDRSVNNFKEPVDMFKTSINQFTSIGEDLTKSMENSIETFAARVDNLDRNLINLYNSVDTNKDEISNISETLKFESRQLERTCKDIVSSVEKVVNNNSDSAEELKEEVINLNSGYKMFSESLAGFIDNLKVVQKDISEGISSTLQSEMTVLTNNIVGELGKSMHDVTEATKQLTRNSLDIGQLIKQTNDFYVTTTKSKDEVLVDEI